MFNIYALLFSCFISGAIVIAEKDEVKQVLDIGNFRKKDSTNNGYSKTVKHSDEPSEENITDIDVIMERQRQLETIRLTGVLTKKAIEDTKFRSEELTTILNKRFQTVSKLFKRLPFIVGYLVDRFKLGVDLELPAMSRMFVMTSVGRDDEIVADLPKFFDSYFKKTNASRSAVEIRMSKEFALKQMKRLTRMIGNNYLGRTMDRVDSAVAFMQSELTRSRDILLRLTELVLHVMDGPYDTISEDRILEHYPKHVKNVDRF